MVSAIQDPFPGPSDFEGGFTAAPGPVLNGLQSTYSGTVVVALVDRAIVAKVLPQGWALADPKAGDAAVAAGKHPVVHLIGDQRAPCLLANGMTQVVGGGYREMILLVPFVVRPPAAAWHNYAVRMFLDNIIPVFGGNEIYGYAKQLARLDRSDSGATSHHAVSTSDQSLGWFLEDLEVTGAWQAAAGATLPRWDELRSVLAMPVLGFRPPTPWDPQEAAVCSYWELDFGSATLAAARSSHRVVTKFRNGMDDWEGLGWLASAPDGAVAMRSVRWRLGFPQAC